MQKSLRKKLATLENPNVTLGQIFLILIDAWQEYLSFNNSESSQTDMNNNNLTAMTTRDIKQIGSSADVTRNYDKNCEITDKYFHESTKTSDCTRKNSKNCYKDLEFDHCYCTSHTPRSAAVYTDDSTNIAYEEKPTPVSAKDIKDAIDITFFSTIYDKCKKPSYRDASNNVCVSNVQHFR